MLVYVVPLALLLMGVRVWLVFDGLLFGAARIALVDVVISAVLVFAAVAFYRPPAPDADTGESSPRSALPGTAAAVLGLPAVVAASLNLVAPATPGEISSPACATAQTYNTHFRALTTGPAGNFARSGPGLGFPQTDRFGVGCVVGFDGYCIGDPVKDPIIEGWNDTRWLLASAHTEGWKRRLARWLSREPQRPRFVSTSYLAAVSPEDERFSYLGQQECVGGLPAPGKAEISIRPTKEPGVLALTARAPHAFNMGVAIAVDPATLRSGTAVRQIPGSGGVRSDGSIEAQWDTRVIRGHLLAGRAATVTVLAVACLDPQVPAGAEAITAFHLPAEASKPVRQTRPAAVAREVKSRLRAMACDSELTAASAAAAKD